jgi:hypothetical protein
VPPQLCHWYGGLFFRFSLLAKQYVNLIGSIFLKLGDPEKAQESLIKSDSSSTLTVKAMAEAKLLIAQQKVRLICLCRVLVISKYVSVFSLLFDRVLTSSNRTASGRKRVRRWTLR